MLLFFCCFLVWLFWFFGGVVVAFLFGFWPNKVCVFMGLFVILFLSCSWGVFSISHQELLLGWSET
jgi:hypothetical protein